MVTAKEGLATTSLSGTANRILVDYKDALSDYRVTEMPVINMFAERFTTETGGDVDISFSKPSMKLEQLEEGATPAYQHTDLRSERINVKEWGIAIGVTRRMLEDSRFSEMELALNEARRAVDRHVTEHAIKAIFGIGDTTFNTGISNVSIALSNTEAEVASFTNNPHGGFFGKMDSAVGDRISDYGLYTTAELGVLGPAATGTHYFAGQDLPAGGPSGATGDISLKDLTAAMELIGAKGLTADTVMISPMHYKNLLNLADFTVPFGVASGSANGQAKGGMDYVNETSKTGVVGQLYGLNVVMNSYIPKDRFGVFDMTVKPLAYVERRGLTVEEANPGFGITGSYMSMRYGLKVIRPEAGVIVIGD